MTGTIAVTKTPSMMVVRRSDGSPLQAQIVHLRHDGPPLRMPVFCEPVRSLRLWRVPRHDGRDNPADQWVADPDAPVCRDRQLFQLIETVAAFGLTKQRRIAIRDARPAMSGQNDPIGERRRHVQR